MVLSFFLWKRFYDGTFFMYFSSSLFISQFFFRTSFLVFSIPSHLLPLNKVTYSYGLINCSLFYIYFFRYLFRFFFPFLCWKFFVFHSKKNLLTELNQSGTLNLKYLKFCCCCEDKIELNSIFSSSIYVCVIRFLHHFFGFLFLSWMRKVSKRA